MVLFSGGTNYKKRLVRFIGMKFIVMKINKLGKISVFALWLTISSFFLIEIAVRIWGYSERYIYDPIYMTYDKTENIPFVHKPGINNARARGLAILNTDILGLRSNYATTSDYNLKKPNEFRIAIVGDSVTFGEGIEKNEDTFVSVLEKNLNEQNDKYIFRAYNFGVSAYSVKEMAYTLSYRMLELDPDLVIMAIIPNDLNLSRTGEVDKYGYTFNRKLSGFIDRNSILKRLLRQIRLVYVVRDIRYRWLEKSKNSITEKQKIKKTAIPSSYKYIVQFKSIAQEKRLFSLVALLPSSNFSDTVLNELVRDEVEYINLSFIKNEFSQKEFTASKFDRHPSEKVHTRIGLELSKYILSRYIRSDIE